MAGLAPQSVIEEILQRVVISQLSDTADALAGHLPPLRTVFREILSLFSMESLSNVFAPQHQVVGLSEPKGVAYTISKVVQHAVWPLS
jgi:hypothetical protein